MTTEERFARIEHVTAGLVEQQRRDQAENRELWRATQAQLDRLTIDTDRLILQVAETDLAIRAVAEAGRAADERLGARIDTLVSAIGEFIRAQGGH